MLLITYDPHTKNTASTDMDAVGFAVDRCRSRGLTILNRASITPLALRGIFEDIQPIMAGARADLALNGLTDAMVPNAVLGHIKLSRLAARKGQIMRRVTPGDLPWRIKEEDIPMHAYVLESSNAPNACVRHLLFYTNPRIVLAAADGMCTFYTLRNAARDMFPGVEQDADLEAELLNVLHSQDTNKHLRRLAIVRRVMGTPWSGGVPLTEVALPHVKGFIDRFVHFRRKLNGVE